MRGTVTTRHLITNAGTIIRQFGVLTYMRCIFAVTFSRRDVTFLDCACRMCRD